MDQVTLIGPQDSDSLAFHIECTRRFNTLVKRTLYIYAECPQVVAAVRTNQSENCVFIAESELVDPQICGNKWIYQQLLKMSVDSLHASHQLSENFLFTDVDTLALQPIKEDLFFRDSQPVYYMQTQHKRPVLCKEYIGADNERIEASDYLDWHFAMTQTVRQLLHLPEVENISSIDACVIWNQRTLRRLKRHIEICSALPWQEAVVNTWVQFLCNYQKNFFRDTGFRNIAFSLRYQAQLGEVIPLGELQENVRLGFSEWQLYSYFNTYLEKSNKRWLGLLGKTPGPHVAEFNNTVSSQQFLKEILEKGSSAPFLYFYPGIKGNEETLRDFLDR
ncbi:MAG: hypothetical protein HRT88_02415 [Lentisphaeraceae bacterium]|nr:hypothetical protein [Lentisphaeraceae bacterium]